MERRSLHSTRARSKSVSENMGGAAKTTSVTVNPPASLNGAIKPSSMHRNCSFSHGSPHPRNAVATRAEVQRSCSSLHRFGFTEFNYILTVRATIQEGRG